MQRFRYFKMNGLALPKIISDRELELLFESIPDIASKKKVLYWDTMLSMGAFMGFRQSECSNLKLGDIDWYRGIIVLRKQKNKVEYEPVPMPDIIAEKLRKHISEYKLKIIGSNGYIFFGIGKSGISGGAVRRFINHLREASGITSSYKSSADGRKLYTFSFHTLRHYYLTMAYKKLRDIRATQVVGRHKSINSALRYQHLDVDDKRNFINTIFTEAPKTEIEGLKEAINELKQLLRNHTILPAL